MFILKITRKVSSVVAKFLKARAEARENAGKKALDAGEALVAAAKKARSDLITKAGDLAVEAVELRKAAAKLEA